MKRKLRRVYVHTAPPGECAVNWRKLATELLVEEQPPKCHNNCLPWMRWLITEGCVYTAPTRV